MGYTVGNTSSVVSDHRSGRTYIRLHVHFFQKFVLRHITMKRSLSDSESDDIYDDSIKASSPSQSCQITDRKKRRGVIEKRRRDRINSSLSELRRLVPSAFEKQGSAKLEKAEILQMTVDHLKMLHQKGLNSYNYPDPHAFATDYRSVGFRECASEVARYLVAVEGMDLQDPLRMRLLGHLQCYSAQREIVSKSTFQNSWNSVSPHQTINTQYGSSTVTAMSSMASSQQNSQSELVMTPQTSHHGLSNSAFTDSRLSHSDMQPSSIQGNMRLAGSGNISSHHQMTSMNSSNQQSSSSLIPSIPQIHRQLPMTFNMNQMQSMMSQNGSNLYDPNSSKPYRPWGSELAY